MSDLVLVKKPNFVIPEGDIANAVTNFQGSYGMAAAFEDSIDLEKGVLPLGSAQVLKETVKGIMENVEMYKDCALQLFFSKNTLTPESMQPFVLHSIKEEVEGKMTDIPMLVASLSAGDYSKHAEPSSAHSPAFFAYAKFLMPKLQSIIHDPIAAGDPEKMRQMLDARIEEIVTGMCGPQNAGAVSFLFYDGGKPSYLAKGTPGIEYEWGWKSSEWTQAAQAVSSQASTPSNTRRRRSMVAGTPDPSPAPQPEIKKEPPSVTPANVINANFAANGTKLVRARPKKLPNHAVKQAYETFNAHKASSGKGVKPNAWKDRVGIEVDPSVIAANKDYFLSVMEIIPDTAAIDPKSTTALASGSVVVPGPAAADVSLQAPITGSEKSELVEYWENSKFVHEAKTRVETDIQKLEAGWPTLDYYFPLTIADLKKHSPESLSEIIDEQPEFALHIMWSILHPNPVSVPRSDTSPGAKQEPVTSGASPTQTATGKRRRTMIPSAA